MTKPWVYLDTSAISHLLATDTPQRMAATVELWKNFDEKYIPVISNLNYEELSRSRNAEYFFFRISRTNHIYITENEESICLTNAYIKHGILKPKSFMDARHIALATVSKCDIIASWNMKHFCNAEIQMKVGIANTYMRYRTPYIVTPEFLIEKEEC